MKPVSIPLIEAKLTEAFFPTPPSQARTPYVCVVADDDRGIRQSLNDMLVSLGFEVLEADDGTETLKYCRSRHIDFVISDFQMRDLDGVRCLVQLRKEDRHVPYLVMSGRNDAEVIKIIQTHGAAFRQKPVVGDVLKEWLRTFNFLPEAS